MTNAKINHNGGGVEIIFISKTLKMEKRTKKKNYIYTLCSMKRKNTRKGSIEWKGKSKIDVANAPEEVVVQL